ncbi:Uncharacterised protein [uncultured archaeon]|nr:Uncharacterised protein [uncultured archaeon]
MTEIKTGQIWKHFKGSTCEIVGIALDSETLEEIVVYKHLEAAKEMPAGQMWVRPKKMFLEKVKRDGKEMQRFTLIKDA